MKKYIAAFDQGTTSSRTLLIDREGRIAACEAETFPQIYRLFTNSILIVDNVCYLFKYWSLYFK